MKAYLANGLFNLADFHLNELLAQKIREEHPTINDFCREAVYMCNCLLTYVDAYIENDTTILFMRKTDAFNAPFITIEIFENKLMQAYHRFNEDCTLEEAEWIRDYCDRHKISRGKFKFNNDIDELF